MKLQALTNKVVIRVDPPEDALGHQKRRGPVAVGGLPQGECKAPTSGFITSVGPGASAVHSVDPISMTKEAGTLHFSSVPVDLKEGDHVIFEVSFNSGTAIYDDESDATYLIIAVSSIVAKVTEE